MGAADQSDRIELFSAVVARPAILELVSRFEEKTGFGVSTKFDLNPLVKLRIDKGERFEVVIVNPGLIDDLVVKQIVAPATRVVFGRVEMGVAVRADAEKPACATMAEFRRTLLNARSIAYSVEGTSGKTFEGVLRRLGIWDAVSDRLKPVAGGRTAIGDANGDAELGVIPVSTILEAPGIALAGTFPSELQTRIDLSGAVSAEAAHKSRARCSTFSSPPRRMRYFPQKGLAALGYEHGHAMDGAWNKTWDLGMAEDLVFKDEAAAEYDRAFAHVAAHFMPFLLRAARVAPGMRVLDIATGTGLSAEAALAAVGPAGQVAAADVSPAMAERARQRLGHAPNASVSVEDGQALSFADCSFDVVLCNLGLMFFPDPARGLWEFRRVLRPGGRAAVSVNTVVERSYNHQINVIIARHMPSLTEAVARTFALGEASRLRSLFAEAGLADIESDTVRRTFVLPSFDAYYGPFERGGASTGQALAALPEELRRAVREEARRDLADGGGPVEAEAEYLIVGARR